MGLEKIEEGQKIYSIKTDIRSRKRIKKNCVVFLDNEYAYDEVNRKLMWEIFEKAGFNEQTWNIKKHVHRYSGYLPTEQGSHR